MESTVGSTLARARHDEFHHRRVSAAAPTLQMLRDGQKFTSHTAMLRDMYIYVYDDAKKVCCWVVGLVYGSVAFVLRRGMYCYYLYCSPPYE